MNSHSINMAAHRKSCRILYTYVSTLSSSIRVAGCNVSHAAVVLAIGFALT